MKVVSGSLQQAHFTVFSLDNLGLAMQCTHIYVHFKIFEPLILNNDNSFWSLYSSKVSIV